MKLKMRKFCSLLCSRIVLSAFVALCAMQFHIQAARAVATPEDIERSFNQSMDSAPDYSKLIPWAFLLAGVIAVVVYFNQRQKKEAIQKPLNHPKKLIREVVRMAEIDAADMKQLKQKAQEIGCENPLTLLLCPSLMNGLRADITPPAEPEEPDQLAA
jgi:hypothetical protein